mmetsp:Transcript_1891/g.2443  ORF Transcript_1891/g.2443 Transcript_1891/m.2443 type:complete len:212 (-) Transcript_1891:514-1149(-)
MNGRLGLIKMMIFGTRLFFRDPAIFRDAEQTGGTANTSLVFHNKKLMALVESSYPTGLRMSPDGRIDTLGVEDFDGNLHQPFTAHPKIDPVTNELLFFGYRIQPKKDEPLVEYGVISPDGKIVRTIDTGVDRPLMMHDFSITESYSCFYDLPVSNLVLCGKLTTESIIIIYVSLFFSASIYATKSCYRRCSIHIHGRKRCKNWCVASPRNQ